MEALGLVGKDGHVEMKARSPIDNSIIDLNMDQNDFLKKIEHKSEFSNNHTNLAMTQDQVAVDINMIDVPRLIQADIDFQPSADQQFIRFKTREDIDLVLLSKYKTA